jgi:NADPH:quinone reductase-like Zn-dependent oxidoreductase
MNKILAMQIHAFGDAAQLRANEITLPPPGRGEVRVRHTAIGVNFVDIYHRTGLYPVGALPATLGLEAAGVVEALGDDVEGIQIDQRVAYVGPPLGGYAEQSNIPANRLVALPDNVSDTAVAGSLLRGITAHMLFGAVRALQPHDFVLVHAAAGGLGQVLGQWERPEGVRFIGTAGSPQKAARARENGYQHVIEYKQYDFVAAVMDITRGQGVHYAVDGIGGATLRKTLQVVRPFGMLASVGQAAGDGHEITLTDINPALGISINRPSVVSYMADAAAYHAGAQATIRHLQAGMRIDVSLQLPLREAQEAHRQLETGNTSGAVLLIP